MLIILPYFPGDSEAASRLGDWIGELGGCKGHELLLVADHRSPDLTDKFKAHFDKITLTWVNDDAWNKWPDSANNMFRKGAKYVEFLRTDVKYFLWLEPDVVPLVKGWADKLESEFKEGVKLGKRFMGDRVQVENVPLHMSGIGVYPSPLSSFSGPAYLAQDVAWDCYAANEILPKAHFTKLIVHNWKHPKFETLDEVNNLLTRHPEMVLFHASKDGSLIELLRKQLARAMVRSGEPTTALVDVLAHETREQPLPVSHRETTCDIFIKTYPQDYEWLFYCLKSIEKFSTGFRNTIVVSPSIEAAKVPNRINIVKPEYCEDGYLSQQIFKVYADTYSDADYILHIDSDTMFTRPVTPQTFFRNGKPTWMMTPIRELEVTAWAQVIKQFMGEEPEFEFMRRFPFVFPRWFYAAFREYIRGAHHLSAESFIKQSPYRNWSEFNCMGAFAYKFHRDKFHWINTSMDEWPELTVEQLWSHGGLTDEIRQRREKILSGGVEHQPPKNEVFEPVDHAGTTRDGNDAPPAQTFPQPEASVTTFPELARYHAGALADLATDQYRRRKVRDALKKVELIR